MCTLTIVPTESGYLAAMNRDERRTRPPALADLSIKFGGTSFVAPEEQSGGTWIGCSERGDLLALLNWNLAGDRAKATTLISRGTVIPRLMDTTEGILLDKSLKNLSLESYAPFRLVAVSLERRAISEARWNGAILEMLAFPWSRGHWFSSSSCDQNAARERGATCEHAARLWPAGRSWLRRLHRSHAPAAGAFSICVHRPDAATVSYTEVHVDEKQVAMSYLAGNPCQREEFHSQVVLPLAARPRLALAS